MACAAFWALPPTAFVARAIVALSDPTAPLASTPPRMAADTAISDRVLRRAAESLNETASVVAAPDLLGRIAVTLGIDAAPSRAARRAADLAGQAIARPGDAPGVVEIAASTASPETAAATATAIAEALVADQDAVMDQARRKRDSELQARIERLKAEALKARGRLTALGGVEADPAEQGAAAANQAAAAQTRVDAIRSIIASGSPPISDRRDVPTGIETLQASFLDLKRQLTKAQETLGDRHTTIISLKAEVMHAAASLTAEWRRLLRIAESDLAAKRQREASLRRHTPDDARRHDTFEAARRAVQVADDNLIRAQAGQSAMPDASQAYRLLAPAAIPTVPTGWPLAIRMVLSALAGCLAALGLRYMPRNPEILGSLPLPAKLPSWDAAEDEIMGDDTDQPWQEERRLATATSRPRAPALARRPARTFAIAMEDLVPRLVAIEPAYGDIPTIMIASNEANAETTSVAAALGAALAALDYRVLVVEVGSASARLAERVDADADPILVDLCGTLRVVFPADEATGRLCLAPALPNGARIASDVARGSRTPIVDDVADEFDMMIIDGKRAAESAEAGWSADAYVRVGRFASRRHDDVFTASFGVPTSALLGTIVGSDFAPREAPAAHVTSDVVPRDIAVSRGYRPMQMVRPTTAPIKTLRRRATGR